MRSLAQKAEGDKLDKSAGKGRDCKGYDKSKQQRTLPERNNRKGDISAYHEYFSVAKRDKPQGSDDERKSYSYQSIGTTLSQTVKKLLEEHSATSIFIKAKEGRKTAFLPQKIYFSTTTHAPLRT
jgi:uncharacterized protein Veg